MTTEQLESLNRLTARCAALDRILAEDNCFHMLDMAKDAQYYDADYRDELEAFLIGFFSAQKRKALKQIERITHPPKHD